MPRTKIKSDVVKEVLIEAGYRCAVPTCRNIITIDMHHIEEVKDGGPNELSNLLALCPTCHALYTRGHIPKEAIYAWKTMLVALNHAFDQESISNLLFLYHTQKETNKRADNLVKNGKVDKNTLFDEKGNIQMTYKNAPRDLNLLTFSGDGVLKFSHLIASGFAEYLAATTPNPAMQYYVYLTDKGTRVLKAWLSGNKKAIQEALESLPQE